VGKLRTHSDNRVSELAKDLVKSWKTQIEKQRREATSTDKTKKEAQPADTKPSTTTPSAKSIDINFEVLNDKVRNACLKLLYSSLELQEDAEPKTVFASAMEIEQAVYVKIGGGTINNDYRSKVRSLSLNLKDKNNPELRQKVLKGEIQAETLVVMRSEELASKVLKEQHEALRQQNLHNAKGAEAQEAETDAFQCGKCKQKKTRYYQMQTRSADEPMTTFVTCVNCNHKWKFS
jgi:transcription elongation factor S-II